jgi:hypothetical protein
MEPWTATKKRLDSVAVPPAPVWVPSQTPLVPSVMPVANDKGDNEMIPGAVDRSTGICLRAEENPRKPQLGDCLMDTKTHHLSFFSNFLFLPCWAILPMSLGSKVPNLGRWPVTQSSWDGFLAEVFRNFPLPKAKYRGICALLSFTSYH